MASLQQIQSRRKAVKNVGQITKAMEVVATTKMRKSQEVALNSRPYAYKILELLDRMTQFAPIETVYTAVRPLRKTLVVIMTSDRGLIGSFNSQVFKAVDTFFENDMISAIRPLSNHAYLVITIGKKATAYATKRGLDIIQSYQGFGDFVDPSEVQSLTDLLTSGFVKGDYDKVIIIAMNFKSTLKQEVISRQLLPIDIKKIRETINEIVPHTGKYSQTIADSAETKHLYESDSEKSLYPTSYNLQPDPETYIFEPSPKEAIELLMPHLVKMELYHLVLEANASEHSARRVAMKNASDNAKELSSDLTLEFNKVRKAGITKAIIEITSTQNALG